MLRMGHRRWGWYVRGGCGGSGWYLSLCSPGISLPLSLPPSWPSPAPPRRSGPQRSFGGSRVRLPLRCFSGRPGWTDRDGEGHSRGCWWQGERFLPRQGEREAQQSPVTRQLQLPSPNPQPCPPAASTEPRLPCLLPKGGALVPAGSAASAPALALCTGWGGKGDTEKWLHTMGLEEGK